MGDPFRPPSVSCATEGTPSNGRSNNVCLGSSSSPTGARRVSEGPTPETRARNRRVTPRDLVGRPRFGLSPTPRTDPVSVDDGSVTFKRSNGQGEGSRRGGVSHFYHPWIHSTSVRVLRSPSRDRDPTLELPPSPSPVVLGTSVPRLVSLNRPDRGHGVRLGGTSTPSPTHSTRPPDLLTETPPVRTVHLSPADRTRRMTLGSAGTGTGVRRKKTAHPTMV